MLNNFIYAQTKDLFLEALGAGNILDEAIVFIEDTKEIWNHGHYFGSDSERFQELEDDLNYFIEQWSNSPASMISTSDVTNGNNKQDKISDLSTIRSNAAKGATALQSYTESDPVFSASAAATIIIQDIDNWNSKTSNNGTVTGVKINGATKNPSTSGVVDLGTVITSHQSLSGKQDTLVSGTNIKTINGSSILGSGNIEISGGSSYDDTELRNIVANKADTTGTYSDMTVGLAEDLGGRPFTYGAIFSFRPTAGNTNSIKDGMATIKSIKGNSETVNGVLVHSYPNSLKSVGANLGNVKTAVRGFLNDTTGEFTSNFESATVVDLIRCLPGRQYYCKNVIHYNYKAAFHFYDENMQYISCDGIWDATNNMYASGTITTPANAHYVRIGAAHTTVNECMVQLVHSYVDDEYKSYWEDVLDLSGILKYFPNGMQSNGEVADEIRYNDDTEKGEAVRRVGVSSEQIVLIQENPKMSYRVSDFGTEEVRLEPDNSAFPELIIEYGFNANDTIRTNKRAIEELQNPERIRVVDVGERAELTTSQLEFIGDTNEMCYSNIGMVPLTSGRGYAGTEEYNLYRGYFSDYVGAANGVLEDSDENLKNFADPISVDLDKLRNLKKSYFTGKDRDGGSQIGVSAQEIQKLYPEIVNQNKNGVLSIDYSKLSVIALKAIDVLNDKNKELESRLERLEKLLIKE